MKKVIVASQNPVKIRSALNAFQAMFADESFEVEGVSSSSGVNDQPATDGETYEGAYNRACHVHKEHPQADFWVGIEGGIEAKGHDMEAFAWVVVIGAGERFGKGRSATFFLPPKVAELIKQGKELGEADDIVFGRTNSKQANGAVGLLTHDVSDRTKYYTEAVVFALIPFRNPEFYFI